MRSKFLPILALVILIFAHHAFAQSKADKPNNISANTNAATPASAPIASDKSSDKNSLALTDAEKADLANLNARYLQANEILAARLRVVLEIECQACEQDYAIKLGIDDARKFYREQVKTAQTAYLTRLEAAQQAHDCLGCALKGDAFVKPEKK